MDEYIDKDKAMKEVDDVEKIFPYDVAGDLDTYCDYNKGWSDACNVIFGVLFNMEKEDVEPVLHAKWEDYAICSNCGTYSDEGIWAQLDEYFKPPYCPYCGAKMDLEG